MIPSNFFQYLPHRMLLNVHSIMNSGLLPGGQNLSKRQTVFFTCGDPVNKEHEDPDVIDLEAPRLAWYKQKVENTSRHGVLGRHQSCSKERVEVLSDVIERNTLPAYFIPKVVRMETEEIIFEKVFETPRLPPKISLRHHWMKELGPEVASTSRSQPTHPTKPQSNLQNRATRSDRPNVPFECSGNRYTFLT